MCWLALQLAKYPLALSPLAFYPRLTWELCCLPKFSVTDPIPFSSRSSMSLSCSIALYPKDHFLAIFKEACVTPVVKKPGFYATDISSYGPISNLLVVSQFLERLVICQLMRYLMCSSAFIGCGSLERIQYKGAVLAYWFLRGRELRYRYLGPLRRSDWWTLHSAVSNCLIVPSVKLSTVVSRPFLATASSI